jgi:hypothetical protein
MWIKRATLEQIEIFHGCLWPASEPYNFFSERQCVAKKARFPGSYACKTTTMRRTILLKI